MEKMTTQMNIKVNEYTAMFLQFLPRERIFFTLCLFSGTMQPSLMKNGVYSEKKEFAHRGAISLPLNLIPFYEEGK